ncbi:hypothetical protein UFOVP1033_56 [uncultured Caudovirales phage]|uniref:Uncharacterized protein n=1 Tax=uncultured Caudovirales phage TaxID=2100421 RepID=A0A6J5T1M5_9CAUD|nr:hypothetical protein UFOVP1033_56 [uncultured Caudovirales phage]CAB4220694.1 hypothetical protein UFOVP1631_56 [uncultured Caudovirales phage]
MARVKASESREENPLVKDAREYSFLKQQIDFLEKQQKEVRERLFAQLDEIGEVDDKGNVIIELPEEVNGFAAVVKQRRVSRKIDELVADEIITEKGMEEQLYKTIRVVDEDALMAALYNDELTEPEIDLMYPQKIVWALVMNKR